MKTLRILSIALIASTVLYFTSCSEAEDALDCVQAPQLYEKFNTAVTTFSSNPTKANCNAMLTAAQNFIDKVKDCPGVTQSQIDLVQKSINDADCNSIP